RLNPARLPPVWSGQQRVPRDYHLRLPLDGETWTSALLAQRLSPGEMFPGQRGPRRYKTQKGDTLVSVAAQFDVPVEVLARSNHIRTSARLSPGHMLTLPEPATQTLGAAASGAPVPAPAAPAAPVAARVTAIVAPPSQGGAVTPDLAARESAEDAAAAKAAVDATRHRRYTITVEVLS